MFLQSDLYLTHYTMNLHLDPNPGGNVLYSNAFDPALNLLGQIAFRKLLGEAYHAKRERLFS